MEALDKRTAEERVAYLNEVCADSTRLRLDVEELLRMHDQPDELLDKTAEQQFVSDAPTLNLDFLQAPTKPGELGRLGHYAVLEVVGQDGMGIVFRALDERLLRVVAIKALLVALKSGISNDNMLVDAAGNLRIKEV